MSQNQIWNFPKDVKNLFNYIWTISATMAIWKQPKLTPVSKDKATIQAPELSCNAHFSLQS